MEPWLLFFLSWGTYDLREIMGSSERRQDGVRRFWRLLGIESRDK